MKTFLLLTLTAILSTSGLLACTAAITETIPPLSQNGPIPVKKTMKAFGSEQELARYFKKLAEKYKQQRARLELIDSYADKVVANEPVPSGDAKESVTNTQHAGVDEGGIVKVHGHNLVVLRRGRLFTVAIGDEALKPISSVDAFAPDLDPSRTWYDEMLISGNTVVVIGYSYERGGTEVGLFDITGDGRLSYRSTYHLRSNDYYSSRNYASRLIGSKLIFYAPQYLHGGVEDPFQSFPAVRKWHKGATPTEFQRIVPATRVYRPESDITGGYATALHTVTVCDLANGGFDCQATAVIGPPGHLFYVSPDSVFVWATAWGQNSQYQSLLFRMPLDGSGPSALGVAGTPIDQFSFLQSEDQHLNVLVSSRGKGDGMWQAEMTYGDLALMRIPITSFSDGSDAVPASNYRKLPKPESYGIQNRFVGGHLIYGSGSGWGEPKKNADQSSLFVVDWKRGDSHQLKLAHGVDRIEQMGSDAVIVGTDGKKLTILISAFGSVAGNRLNVHARRSIAG
jgi:hypothetical protein